MGGRCVWEGAEARLGLVELLRQRVGTRGWGTCWEGVLREGVGRGGRGTS